MRRMATTLLVAGLLASPLLVLPTTAHAGISVGISVGIAPPALPVYAQPVAPGPGYLWTPGYWAWNPAYASYYWVPGAWVTPPAVGLLWTPGWWGVVVGGYRWHAGYWGPHVGFYGGVNYGFGYFGSGYVGGRWRGHQFFYNRAVSNVNAVNVHTVYVDRTVIGNVGGSRISYNGGRGGTVAQPTALQRQYATERRYQPTALQARQRETAMRSPTQRFHAGQLRPAVFATQYAGRFQGAQVVRQPALASSRMATAPAHERGFVQTPQDRARRVGSAPPMAREERSAPPRRGYAPGSRAPRERMAPGRRRAGSAASVRAGRSAREKHNDGGYR
ncbi:MAG: hypothetical protein EPN38_04700 [Rhodanobacteraceae bacterium]|nr:MAG: hypothetical protein EPN38_04700 [Rhodanobacteraceae bacterium]